MTSGTPDAEARRNLLSYRLDWNQVDEGHLRQLIALARDEDLLGSGWKQVRGQALGGDPTTAMLPLGSTNRFDLRARQAMVPCGLPLIPIILDVYRCSAVFEPSVSDGQPVEAGTTLGQIAGPVTDILTSERVVLNFLQRLSGVATHTLRYVEALKDSPTRLLDTRKMTPGFRALEKYAVACAGGWNHRFGLFDRILIKDNHLAAAGIETSLLLTQFVRHARAAAPNLRVQVEVDRLDQIGPVLDAGVDCILLDNFTNGELEKAVALIGQQAATEASGGITLERIPSLAFLGLDFISTGAPVHQSQWVDIGLDWHR